MRALPDGVHATALDLPAVADLDALADEVAGWVAPGSVVVGHSLGGVVAMPRFSGMGHRLFPLPTSGGAAIRYSAVSSVPE